MDKTKIFLIITISIAAIIAAAMFALKKTDYSAITNSCDHKIAEALRKNSINPESPLSQTKSIVSGFRVKALSREKEFAVPYSASIDAVKKTLTDTVDFTPAKIALIKRTKTAKETTVVLELDYRQLKIYRLVLKQKPLKGKIAIVLDDWGYNESILNPAINLNTPITFAILPNLAYSKKIAETLNKHGDEVILHLPLEPHNADKHPLEKNTILTTMSKQEITDITLNDINSLPNLRGINNHMGSKATEDQNVMGTIFDIIKQRNLYFLDSFTSKQSALSKVAVEKNIVLYKRDIFLDDVNDKQLITKQMLKAKDIAQQTGMAIAIGHAKALTVETLSEIIPLLKSQGFKFVYLSQLSAKPEAE